MTNPKHTIYIGFDKKSTEALKKCSQSMEEFKELVKTIDDSLTREIICEKVIEITNKVYKNLKYMEIKKNDQ